MDSNQSPPVDPNTQPDSEPQLQVVVHAGPLAGKGYLFNGDVITFGRDPDNNDIAWQDGQVSRNHARLTRRSGQLILEDLGSTNGTLVNGKPISAPHILQPADIISIGSSVFGVKGFAAPQTVAITQISPRLADLTAVPAASSPPPPHKQAAPRPTPPPQPKQSRAGGPRMSMLAIAGAVVLILIILGLAATTAYFLLQGRNTAETRIPVVVITAPVDGSQVTTGQPVTVQATASDPSGVVRMELWVSGAKMAETASPVAQGQPTLTGSMQWTPQAPGSYTLEVKAFNAANRVNEPRTVTVNAAAGASTATPTATPQPGTPTATVPTAPMLTALTDLNVRIGPGTFYDLIGLLPAGGVAEISGRDDTRQWWQIKTELGPEGRAWVIADPQFSKTVNTANVPVVPAPPTPTGTPTDTPTATASPSSTPTATGTSTPAPPTHTPTITPSPTPSEQVQFVIEPTKIESGDCVQVGWNVTGVKEVYYQGQGVAGQELRTECPVQTTTYTLRVVKLDNSDEQKQITVEVTNPLKSSGSVSLNLGGSIDFDNGSVPGNDFTWREDGEFRWFEALSGASVAPQGIHNSLDALSLDTCKAANYGQFTYLDGSDVIINPANELTDGRTACFKTTEGSFGKMRFPQYNTGAILVEWQTWR